MSKQQKQILVVAIVLLLVWYFKNRQPNFRAAYTTPGEGEGEVAAPDDYYYGGGGSGYVASGTDGTDTQHYDPDSNYTEETILNEWGFAGDFKPGGRVPVPTPDKPLPSSEPSSDYNTKSLARILR